MVLIHLCEQYEWIRRIVFYLEKRLVWQTFLLRIVSRCRVSVEPRTKYLLTVFTTDMPLSAAIEQFEATGKCEGFPRESFDKVS